MMRDRMKKALGQQSDDEAPAPQATNEKTTRALPGWHKSWRVLMDLANHKTEEQFADLEARFERNYREYCAWANRFKRDPRTRATGDGLEVLFRSPEFADAFEQLIRTCEHGRLFCSEEANDRNDARKQQIRKILGRLRLEAGVYVRHDEN
jgi:hypothetical protein